MQNPRKPLVEQAELIILGEDIADIAEAASVMLGKILPNISQTSRVAEQISQARKTILDIAEGIREGKHWMKETPHKWEADPPGGIVCALCGETSAYPNEPTRFCHGRADMLLVSRRDVEEVIYTYRKCVDTREAYDLIERLETALGAKR